MRLKWLFCVGCWQSCLLDGNPAIQVGFKAILLLTLLSSVVTVSFNVNKDYIVMSLFF